MTICSSCESQNRDSARFCATCGDPLPMAAWYPLSAGTLVQGRYKVLAVIGRGGMGAVYLVEDQRVFRKKWALKELVDTTSSSSERAQARVEFEAEARMLVGLSHPNLPQIVDFFSESNRQYLVMELVEGRTLEVILAKAPGLLPEKQVREWAIQLCDVLTYLHERQPPVIFRDMKPSNVMLSSNGVIRLIDFGIARTYKMGQHRDTSAMGTENYAPPEQWGKGQTDSRSDIYSLGMTLYQLLTGVTPPNALVRAAKQVDFTPVRQLNAAISSDLEAIVTKATQLDPTQRYQTAAQMKQALMNSALVHALPVVSEWQARSPNTVAPSPSHRRDWRLIFRRRMLAAKDDSHFHPYTVRLPRRLEKIMSAILRERNEPIIHEIANIIGRKDLLVQGTTFMLRGIDGFGGTELATALKKELLSSRKGLVLVATVPLSNSNTLPDSLEALTVVLNSLKRDGGGIRWRLRRAIRRAHAQMREIKYRQPAKIVTDSQLGLAAASFSLDTPKSAFGLSIGWPFNFVRRKTYEAEIQVPPREQIEASIIDGLGDLVDLLISENVRVVLIFDGLDKIDALAPLAYLAGRPGVYTVIVAHVDDHERWSQSSSQLVECFSKVSRYISCQWNLAEGLMEQLKLHARTESDRQRIAWLRQSLRYRVRGVPKRVRDEALQGLHTLNPRWSVKRAISRFRNGRIDVSESKWPAIIRDASMQTVLDAVWPRLFTYQGAPALTTDEVADKAYLAIYEFTDWLLTQTEYGNKVSRKDALTYGVSRCGMPFDQSVSRKLINHFLELLTQDQIIVSTQRSLDLSQLSGRLKSDAVIVSRGPSSNQTPDVSQESSYK